MMIGLESIYRSRRDQQGCEHLKCTVQVLRLFLVRNMWNSSKIFGAKIVQLLPFMLSGSQESSLEEQKFVTDLEDLTCNPLLKFAQIIILYFFFNFEWCILTWKSIKNFSTYQLNSNSFSFIFSFSGMTSSPLSINISPFPIINIRNDPSENIGKSEKKITDWIFGNRISPISYYKISKLTSLAINASN